MSLFRRRKADLKAPAVAETAPQSPSQEAVTPAAIPTDSPRVERALITLTNKMQQCLDRLDVLERRLDEMAENVVNAPSHSDVLEVRIHSAKLAAELARATVELRGEIGMASDEARRAARLARSNEPEEIPVALPVDLDITAADDEISQRRSWSESA